MGESVDIAPGSTRQRDFLAFNGRTQINVTCDYGSAYAMPQAGVEKFGHGASCIQYVALVLHFPSERVDPGGGVVAEPRSVICDV